MEKNKELEEKLLEKMDELIKSEKWIKNSSEVTELLRIVEEHYDL